MYIDTNKYVDIYTYTYIHSYICVHVLKCFVLRFIIFNSVPSNFCFQQSDSVKQILHVIQAEIQTIRSERLSSMDVFLVVSFLEFFFFFCFSSLCYD